MTKQLSLKADLALADLETGGGLLTQEQNETFIRRLEDSTTILSQIRTYGMSGPTARINAIGFGDFITYPANWDTSLSNANNAGRKFIGAYRTKPVTSHVELVTKPVKAVVYLPYETLEDNIERGNLQNTVITMIANKFAHNLEAMIVRGEEGGASPIALLNLMDGVYALCNDHTVNAGGAVLNDDLFVDALKAMPKKYRTDLSALRFMSGSDAELELRRARAARNTALGDQFLTGALPVDALGVRVKGHTNNPEDSMLLTPPQNIIFGIQRNIRVETDRDIEEEQVKIVVTARVAVTVENPDAAVKISNIGSSL
jgi:HK97 family phage major capsid protein